MVRSGASGVVLAADSGVGGVLGVELMSRLILVRVATRGVAGVEWEWLTVGRGGGSG